MRVLGAPRKRVAPQRARVLHLLDELRRERVGDAVDDLGARAGSLELQQLLVHAMMSAHSVSGFARSSMRAA